MCPTNHPFFLRKNSSLKQVLFHRRSASVDENTRTRRKFQSKSADYDTPVRPVDDENEQLEAPVKGASPGKRAGAAVAKKAMSAALVATGWP